MAKIGEIEGIGPAFQEKLENVGIATTEALLDDCRTAKQRASLAEKADIQPKRLMSFVSRADFMRIKGVGRQFSELLQNVDIHTVGQLAMASADSVNEAMTKVNAEKNLTKAVPSAKQIQGFIDIAKSLDKAVEL
jgi:predicted flap endonuclease-1-like 5' DNA nuclease